MSRELYFIIPKLFAALGFGFLGSVFFDALFKIPENGTFKLSGIMFYGGLICGIIAIIPLLCIFKENSQYSPVKWLDMLTVPFIVFHAIGRLGCFLGGCCYGRATDGVFGVIFPDNPEAGIFHYDQKVLPTQLFEACGLIVLAVTLHFIKREKFTAYCFAYPVMRFMLEFLRGDDRGSYLGGLSPSQLLSIIIIVCAVATVIFRVVLSKRNRKTP